jgi:hypothetical protein
LNDFVGRAKFDLMQTVESDIAAYESQKTELERTHIGEWVLFHDQHLVGLYDTSEEAADIAVRRFGRGPYLIRQVGGQSVDLPASVMFCLDNHARAT